MPVEPVTAFIASLSAVWSDVDAIVKLTVDAVELLPCNVNE